MLHRAAKNAYSWWWASHTRTKQSKWLDQKLQAMEEKVEYILHIINEDGDSFAARAEMYYRKRPEIVNFVEDAFRGYRALAERHDHLLKELQSANRTIATVYPERVQLAMDEEDDNSPTKADLFCALDKPERPKDLPTAPKLSPPKISSIPKKIGKMPFRMMSKKGLIKMNVADANAPAAASSGLSKAEALENIDKLQKAILALQTEKEFIKSSYENGLAKYWDIERQITEMQAKVISLQDEFGIGTQIEDDEARSLMAATALKSCQLALVRLHEKQEQSSEEATLVYQRIQEVRKKFNTLKKQLNGQGADGNELSEEKKLGTTSAELKNFVGELDIREQEIMSDKEHDKRGAALLREKIKDQLLDDDNAPLNMSELAENIEEVVDMVISLETAASSQISLVNRLRSETNELQTQLEKLEEEKGTRIEGSDTLSNKIRLLEEELNRVQSLNERLEAQKQNLESHLTAASANVDSLSEKLPSVKPDLEIKNNNVLNKEVRDVSNADLVKQYQVSKGLMFPDGISGISDVGSEREFKEHELMKLPGYPMIFNDVKMGEEMMKCSNSDYNPLAVAQGLKSVSTLRSNPYLEESMYVSILDDNPTRKYRRYANIMAPGVHPVVTEDFKLEDEVRDNMFDRQSIITGKEDHRMQSSSLNSHDLSCGVHTNAIFEASQAGSSKTLEKRKAHADPEMSKDVNMQVAAKKDDNSGYDTLFEAGEDRNSGMPSNDHSSTSSIKYSRMETDKNGKDPSNNSLVSSEDEPNWKELFLHGIEDRETMLLQAYTSMLRNYNEVKKKLSEVEKRNRASQFKSAVQMKVLKNANASKDEEILTLNRKLGMLQKFTDEGPDAEESTDICALQVSDASSPNSDQKPVPKLLNLTEVQPCLLSERTIEIADYKTDDSSAPEHKKFSNAEDEVNIKSVIVDEPDALCSMEQKIRMDLDDLLEENIEFWLKFSTSVHQIQKFQTIVHDLLAELVMVKESRKQDGGSDGKNRPLTISDVRIIYRHLREIQTELTLWWEHNAVLKEDLQNRLSSLSSIQEEISRLANAGSEAEEAGLSQYQAAKFQGEVMNMKQENKRVENELLAGLERVRGLQIGIQKTLAKLDEELGLKSHTSKHRSRIPLRSFLFGVRLRRQRQSIFTCISPQLSKQCSDLSTAKT